VRASTLRLLTFAITLYASAPSALSHPLPGSTLTFARGDENVELTLTIPVPELIVAQLALVGIGEVAKNSDFPVPLQSQLFKCLFAHMTVTPVDHSALNLQLLKAQVQDAHYGHVGHYNLLFVHLSAPLRSEKNLFPATLTYDAVLHEVRNHRATVWFAEPDKNPVLLGKIWFDAVSGRARPLQLSR
jgi:hypothetical protein